MRHGARIIGNRIADFGHGLDPNDARTPQMHQDDGSRRLKEISARMGNCVMIAQAGKTRISLLNHVVDRQIGRQLPSQPAAKRGFVRQNVAGQPTGEVRLQQDALPPFFRNSAFRANQAQAAIGSFRRRMERISPAAATPVTIIRTYVDE